jgi:hypothetical protein
VRRLLGLLALLLLATPPAHARADALGDAEAGLRGRSVYVAPGAPAKLSAAARARVERDIARRDLDLRIALLPESAGEADRLAGDLYRDLGSRGAVAVAAGRHFSAGPGPAVRSSLQGALGAGHDDVEGLLLDFVKRVDGTVAQAPTRDPGRDTGRGVSPLLLILALGALAFAVVSFSRGRQRRREEAAHLEQVRGTVAEDLTALGEDIRALDLDVQMPGVDREAKAHYARAVEGYDRANGRLNTARRVDDLAGVGETLEDARYEMTAAKARLAGEPVPERRPPCFFDPRHGPSVTDAAWAPPGGSERDVPVCAACATDIADGREPASREVEVGGGMMPWWQAGGGYGGYYGGMFSPFGLGAGFLGGMVLGDMLDPDPGWGAGGDGDDFGGGDWGGGDFGGGDFGGGDFGGGDF